MVDSKKTSEVEKIIDILENYKWNFGKDVDLGYGAKSPFTILAPNIENGDYSIFENRSEKLRVCCLSGDLLKIPYDAKNNKFRLLKKEHAKFATGIGADNSIFTDGKGKKNIIPDSFENKYKDIFEKMRHQNFQDNVNLVDKLFKKVDFSENNEELQRALDFAVLAEINKNTKPTTVYGSKGERWIQEILLKNSMAKKYKPEAVLFFDEEIRFKFKEARTRTNHLNQEFKNKEDKYSEGCRIDLIALNSAGNTENNENNLEFGLIELKYDTGSMETNDKNSLRDHYLDFKYLINENKEVVIKEFIRRFWFLFKFNLVDNSWKIPFQEIGLGDDNFWNKTYEDMLAVLEKFDVKIIKIWIGFLFVNDNDSDYTLEQQRARIDRRLKVGLKDKIYEDIDDTIDAKLQIYDNGRVIDYNSEFSDLKKYMDGL